MRTIDTPSTSRPAKTGVELLRDPSLNKGTAFTYEERRRLGLIGLLPPHVLTQDEQARRVMANVRSRGSELGKYVEMADLLNRNETLFYRVVVDNIEEIMPIIYTPVVGAACQQYGRIFRRSRGLWISRREKGIIREVLRHWPHDDVSVIVVTDGERILGLGDLGADGMGIPVGKLSLYTACAGVHPAATLPVTLDVGTENRELLEDPLYLGTREPRLRGREYDELVDEFVCAVREVFPGALLQFEDFANHNAFRLLEKYRRTDRVFNDDIQGTAAVTLAGLYAAARITGSAWSSGRILFHGAGEAAIGIGNLVVSAMIAEGMSPRDAMRRCWFMDSKGLVESSRADLQEHKRPYAHEHAPISGLVEAIGDLRPAALVGVSGKGGGFTEDVVAEMSRVNARPIVFVLSNPTSNAECTAEQAYSWSEGRAVFASGSPFAPVPFDGRTFLPGQANNAYIFPGVGLGVVASGARRVTDEMFFAAAKTLAGLVSEDDLEAGRLFPPLTKIRSASAEIAAAVAEVAYRRGLSTQSEPADLPAAIRALQYEPVYKSYL